MMRATVTPVAKVRQAVMMTVSPSLWQAQSSVKGSLVVSCSDAISWLARSEAEEGRRWRRADFKNRSGSGTSNTNKKRLRLNKISQDNHTFNMVNMSCSPTPNSI